MPGIFTKAKWSAVMVAIHGNRKPEREKACNMGRDLAAKHWPRVAGRIAQALAA